MKSKLNRTSNSYKNILLISVLFLISTGIGIYFRLYPLTHYRSHEVNEKASMLVINKLRTIVKENVDQNFPDLSPVDKNQVIKKQFDELLRKEGKNVRESIKKMSLEMQESQPAEQKMMYLLESDPYLYYSLTENILETGRISKHIKGSKYFNELMLAPLGYWEPLNLHPYIGFLIYRTIRIFNPTVDLMYAVSFTPLVIAVLALIPFYIVCTQLGCRIWVTFTGSVFFLLSPIFLKRSMFGWYDNDPYSVFFPLMILAFLFHGLNPGLPPKKRTLSAVLCFAAMTLYALFWHGWMFFLIVILLAGVILVLAGTIRKGENLQPRQLLFYFGLILTGSFAGIALIFGPRDFFVLFEEGWNALSNFLTPRLTLWPDLYISVGELKKTPLPLIVELTGGWFVFAVSMIGVLTNFSNAFKNKDFRQSSLSLILLLLLLCSLILTLGAQRFVLLNFIPLILFFTIGLEHLIQFVKGKFPTAVKNSKNALILSSLLLYILVLSLAYFPIRKSTLTAPALLDQIYNDTWNNVLNKIREETPPESIINSWWTPGHFIKAIAKRKVTFDGATINKPQAYWLASTFLETDEKKAAGILRMLNNSANQAAEFLQEHGLKLSQSVNLLKQITATNRINAKRILENYLTPQDIESLLQLTHQRPPPSYLLIFHELIQDNIEFKFISGRDFEKIEKINSDPSMLKYVPARNSKEFISFLWDIAGGPNRYSQPFAEIARQNNLVFFEQNVAVDIARKSCQIRSEKYGEGVPQSLFYLSEDQIIEKEFPSSNLPYSALLFQEGPSYNIILLDRGLAKSLLVKLYFFDGKGLKYFEPFIKESDLTKRTQIYVYRINWDLFEKDLNSN